MPDSVLPVSRRRLLRWAALAGGGTLLAWPQGPRAQTDPAVSPRRDDGRVVAVSHPGAMTNPARPNSDPVSEVVEVLVDTALLAFTGTGSLSAAWGQFVQPSDRVLIKVNSLGAPNMSTSEAVVRATVRGLRAAGVPPDRVLIYDQYRSRMARAHFAPGRDILGVSVEYNRDQGHMREAVTHGTTSSRFAAVVDHATAIINLPVIKDHSACGVSIAMRNVTHGLVDNPTRFNQAGCGTSIPDIYNTDLVKSKVRLCIVDGLRVLYDGGPTDNPAKVVHNTLYVGTDPVALDTVGLDLIEAKRRDAGLDSLEAQGRGCPWLALAERYGLGVHERSRIGVEDYVL